MKWLEKNWWIVAAVVVFYLWNKGYLFATGSAATTAPNQVVSMGDGTYGVL